jgi:hypothetical protein
VREGVAFVLAAAALTWSATGSAEAGEKTASADARSDGGGAEANAQVVTVEDAQGVGGAGKSRAGSSLTCNRYNALWFGGTPAGAGNGAPEKSGEESRTALGGDLSPGDWYGLVCTDANGQEVVNELRRYTPGEPRAPVVDPAVLAQEAASRLVVDPPEVQLSPKTDVNQITQLTTWMWVTNWDSQSASASVPGVTSTVTAKPTTVTWDMGNGDQVVCNGPGTPFDFSRPEESQATDCSYTYRHSSRTQPGGVYQVSATMSYDVSWSAEGAPGGGALPAVSETSTFPVRVIEIHAVEGVGTGGR